VIKTVRAVSQGVRKFRWHSILPKGSYESCPSHISPWERASCVHWWRLLSCLSADRAVVIHCISIYCTKLPQLIWCQVQISINTV